MRSAESIFHGVKALSSDAERDAYLDGACGGDLSLRSKVEALLRADAEAGSFLRTVETGAVGAGSPAPGSLDTEGETGEVGPVRAAEPGLAWGQEEPGQMIGRFKLLQHIGEGGFGSVWMAEQKQPVKRRVALKIIKLGMDTKQVIARFEAERQALAMMDHPNIAKVLDAGTTETGRPFFVMELVRGVPIAEYCDRERLETRGRLSLFSRVCQAIQHAHQKGIIHRDIKPSNVLVTLHDGEPVPKVIDFGIAKATNTELTQKTLFTEHKQMIGTPAYMSPEQAEMSGLDIDTRADIYSLGVLLYELLTGTTPFTADDLLSKGFAEMMRVIRESEPPKPSTRLATLGESATRTAERQRADVRRLGLSLRGDLDWIVMKCLEKDRTRRYETANGVAEDIRRHLGDEPVVAGPPGASYRLKKFVKRNRGPVLASGVVAAVLILGVVGTSLGLAWALRERDRAGALAEQERERGARAMDAVTQMLAESGVFDMKGIGVGSTVALAPATTDEVYFEVTRHEDGGTTIVPMWIDDRREGDPGDLVVELLASEAVYWTKRGMAQARERAEDADSARARAVRELERANAVRDFVVGMISDTNPWSERNPRSGSSLISIEERRRILDTASTRLGWGEITDGETEADLRRAIGRGYLILDLYGEAHREAEHALRLARSAHGADHPETLRAVTDLAVTHRLLGRHAEADGLHDWVNTTAEASLGVDADVTVRNLSEEAWALQKSRMFNEAGALYREVVSRCRRSLGPDHGVTLARTRDLAWTEIHRLNYDEAERICRELIAAHTRLKGARHPRTLEVEMDLGIALRDANRIGEAIGVLRGVLEKREELMGEDHVLVAQTRLALGVTLRNAREYDRAETMLLRAYNAFIDAVGPGHDETLSAQRHLTGLYLMSRRPVEAEAFSAPNAIVYNTAAWALVSAPSAAWRDPAHGVTLARLAVERSDAGDTSIRREYILDTLAFGLLQTGAIEEAGRVIEEAVLLAEANGTMNDDIRGNLAAIRAAAAGEPWDDPYLDPSAGED